MSCQCFECIPAESRSITAPPTITAISLEYAKRQAGIDISDPYQEQLIWGYIKAATILAQGFIGKTFVTTGYEGAWNYFPYCLKITDINVAITEISYTDTDNVVQTLDATDFELYQDNHYARIVPSKSAGSFPSTKAMPNAVKVQYTAGYGFTDGSVSSLTRVDNLVTVETAIDHEAITGDTISISGAAEADYNGDFVVTVTDATHFTYVIESEPPTPATGTPRFLNRHLDDDLQLAISMMVVKMLSNRGDCSDTQCGKINCEAKMILEGYKDASIRMVC
jgi:hypothetical protein